jgi:hypothetical protein
MIRRTLVVVGAVLVVAFNSPRSVASDTTTAASASVVSFARAPMAKATTTLSLDWGQAQPEQMVIADVLSYSGSRPTISAPEGWHLICDDYGTTTRQSLYWHTIQANDSSAANWTFSEPVDAQGAILLLDNVASDAVVDLTDGKTSGGNGTEPVASGGDLTVGFLAADIYIPGLAGQIPASTSVKETASNEFWILSTHENQSGAARRSAAGQGRIFDWTAAQVSVKSRQD